MAFAKYANASIIQPLVSLSMWDEVRSTAMVLGSAFENREARSIAALQKFDPQQYMLSHCTIIASVDTEKGPGLLGRRMEGGQQINRKYADYLITPQTSKYVNNNQDSWERKLLLGTFRTFIGGQNYVEHLQIPELSKGRVIDAAARDIGDSIYVDILVATELKHKPLVAAIQSRELQTLSMGCTVAYTICSKCGNVAEDETQLCNHIKYAKGNTYIDAVGKVRKVAELCGHSTDPASVKFIEASWVANPAFTGAVLRNILTPAEIAAVGPRIQMAYSLPVPSADPNQMAKAARDGRVMRRLGSPISGRQLVAEQDAKEPAQAPAAEDKSEGGFDFGQGGEFGGGEDKGDDKGGVDKAVDEYAELVKEKALDKLRGELTQKELAPRADLDENQNNTLIREASKSEAWRNIARVVLARVPHTVIARKLVLGLILFKKGGWASVRAANSFSGREVLAISRFLDEFEGSKIAGEARVYRTVLAAGGTAAYGDLDGFLAACRRILGRSITTNEQDALVTKGRLFDIGTS